MLKSAVASAKSNTYAVRAESLILLRSNTESLFTRKEMS